ncbi:MAG: hypothetical protein PWR20_29 [Bacteroidales bacterium]|jgi:uncharacterized protein (DUF58 family)|nr:hypothetical protein [Bacteroidales bacterium]MDN5328604.1 hypothetical protein [Bacteroidales bacterium]
METTEIFKKVRKIEIKTRGLSNQIFSGEYHSSFKGKGMSFSEVREYQYGDDIRNIDWNVTARFNHPYVKIFEEERELTVILLIDVSGSNKFGSKQQYKQELITEIAAVLSFSAIANNDKVGVIFFSDRIEKFIPPKKGSSHILRIIRELIDFESLSNGTNISESLRFFTNAIKKRSVAFLISDFEDHGYDQALRIAARKHDVIALQITDEREKELPPAGLLYLVDPETEREIWVDTSNPMVRERFKNQREARQRYINNTLSRAGIDFVQLSTGSDYVRPLINLFKRREFKR